MTKKYRFVRIREDLAVRYQAIADRMSRETLRHYSLQDVVNMGAAEGLKTFEETTDGE